MADDDLRERNKKAAEKQKRHSEKKEKNDEIAEQINSADPAELRKQLSNKNEEYVFKLNKRLVDDDFTEEEAEESINGLLPEIIANQIKGVPANQLYGPVTKKAGDIAHPVKPKKATPFWALAIDTSLLFFALFGLLYGIVGLTSKNQSSQNQTGIVTLVLLAAMWGVLLTWFNLQMKKPKAERPGLLITIGYMGAGLVIMFIFLGLMQFVPKTFNPPLNGVVYLVLAVIAFGGRFLYRRYMHITTRGFI
ncbi:DUF1129 family protein [Companilactobacillus sp.]|jgi:uncharacterized membrane-anchored protein|uniref:DUF1129 family protein n=1 Tax=Companilactobacillus sp. TaxID=2767905 RepID=UPI0025C05723|nr:DUF1129 family protein [Companilactobacillus sp.]MCH4009330.1 DUF1129 domain-containing protein [Companilactobacillus sp.]MCH4050491.1 DUF1129 domain-containing protein [Companilactobacillus sp.]MCH4077272.1 DUF1129 domain-containing protein [Companilactobacillus sp.]MCH4125848.1 DUF1129 domain-containing protein [Companilactobacillus sp.]MCI1311557.1 DUF1129 domain-containing protein [Companilactobacillus sp.]